MRTPLLVWLAIEIMLTMVTLTMWIWVGDLAWITLAGGSVLNTLAALVAWSVE